MRPETILENLRGLPARPFRIVMNSGRTYDVRNRDLVEVGRDHLLYFTRTPGAETFDRWEAVSLMLIERIEPIDQPQPTSSPTE